MNDSTKRDSVELKEGDFYYNLEKREYIPGWGCRHQQCFILFLCLTTAYSMRSCMGVALVAMTQASSHPVQNDTLPALNTSGTLSNFESVLHALMLSAPFPIFRWPKEIQDTILSSFFWGYMLLQVPAGQLAHRYGARYLIFAAMAINAIVSFCLPWAAFYGGWPAVVVFRILQGLSQACLFPSTHTFFGKWAPLSERGRLTAMVYGGQALGTVLGLPITGFLAASSLGWPVIFRFYGTLSGIVGAVWLLFGADTPALHPKISTTERKYIEEGLGQTNCNSKEKLPVPWKSILTSKAMWAIVIAHIGHTWGQLTLYSEVPAFMDKVLRVDIRANGLLTALPFMVMFFTNFFFSWFTDYIIIKKWLSVTETRKLANTIGAWPPALCLVLLAVLPKNIYIVESLLIAICALKISGHLGFQVNHIDIAPNFAGTMMSISNFASNGVSSLAPLTAAYILTDVSDEALWRKVFYVSAGFYFFSNLFYVFMGTGEKAAWNEPQKKPHSERQDLDAERMLKI